MNITGLIEVPFGPRDFPVLVDYHWDEGDVTTGVSPGYVIYSYWRADGKPLARRTLAVIRRDRTFRDHVYSLLHQIDPPE